LCCAIAIYSASLIGLNDRKAEEGENKKGNGERKKKEEEKNECVIKVPPKDV